MHHKLRLCAPVLYEPVCVCVSAAVSKPNFILWIFFFWDHQSKRFRRELVFTLHVGHFKRIPRSQALLGYICNQAADVC